MGLNLILVSTITQVAANGSEWIELERANPSGYCVYNLIAFTLNADLARNGRTSNLWGEFS